MPTVKGLQTELRSFGLPITGLKEDLIKRLDDYKNDNIWEASVRGDIKKIELIIKTEKKIGNHDINRLSLFNRSALHQAALVGQVNVVEYLIKNGGYDYNGNAYLSGTPSAREIMKKYGFKGICFSQLPEVKLLNAKRKLCLSKIEIYIDYDVMILIQNLINRNFIDTPKNHKIFQIALDEKKQEKI